MTKQNIYKLFYAISIFLIIGFCIRLGADYFKYNLSSSSAPFYTFIIVRTLEFILPSIIIFIIAKVVKSKNSSK